MQLKTTEKFSSEEKKTKHMKSFVKTLQKILQIYIELVNYQYKPNNNTINTKYNDAAVSLLPVFPHFEIIR